MTNAWRASFLLWKVHFEGRQWSGGETYTNSAVGTDHVSCGGCCGSIPDLKKSPASKESIAVLGSASRWTDDQVLGGFRVGREIARLGFSVITGMTLGVPYGAALGAWSNDGLVVGVSPASCREEHIDRYGRPIDAVDVAIYTGMGLEGRQPILVRSARAAIFIGGEFGTLAEFSAAWTAGNKVMGVLQGLGGTSDLLQEMVARTESRYGNTLICDTDAERLVRRVCEELNEGATHVDNLSVQALKSGAPVRALLEKFLSPEGEESSGGKRK